MFNWFKNLFRRKDKKEMKQIESNLDNLLFIQSKFKKSDANKQFQAIVEFKEHAFIKIHKTKSVVTFIDSETGEKVTVKS